MSLLKNKKILILLFAVLFLTIGVILIERAGSQGIVVECETCIDLIASPNPIGRGESSTLTLKVNNTPDSFAVCSITPGVISDESLNDGTYNYVVSPGGGGTGDFTYIADCTGGGGQATDSITITVINMPPTATDLSVDEGDYCTIPLRPIFSWAFSDPEGDSQGAYQVQVDNNSNFSSPEIDSGKVLSSSESYAAPTPLSYNTTYYWRLKVWDEYDAGSNWISGPSFATPLHAYPDPEFTWFPASPTEEELVQFCATQEAGVCSSDESTCYDIGGAIPPPSCSGKTFLWTFPVETEFATGSSPISENPLVKFTSTGVKDVSLEITDEVGSCSRTKTVGVMWPLPEWEETSP